MQLRDYQQNIVDQCGSSEGNLLIQADTGAGKTRVLAAIAASNQYVIKVAHRNILVKQLSRELAKFDIKHGIIAPKYTRRMCILEHRKLGKDCVDNNADKYVVSVDSLLSRYKRGLLELDCRLPWLIIVDEAHHMIDENKWGKLLKIFPNARVIGATATPCRLDQVSLATGKGGVSHALIQADQLKQDSLTVLIKRGFVSDFKCYSLPEYLNTSNLKMGRDDYTYKSLKEETGRYVYEMAGDAIKHYKRFANCKQALVFCVDIAIAKTTADEFKNAGIASATIHSKMGASEVARVFNLFESKVINVLVNVDMIGEGVDVPAIEALIMLRKTASFGMYRQWIGRALRPEFGKDHAILIDHVGNVRSHGLPDEHVAWDLENPPRAKKSNLIPCPKCYFLVKALTTECPECGEKLWRAGDLVCKHDVNYLDVTLVEQKRREIECKHLHETVLEISERPKMLAQGSMGKAIHRVQIWFANLMESELSIAEMNTFFSKTSSPVFWLDNFTLADAESKNLAKCQKVYKKWLKSK